jgi:hypothetical protein
MSRAVDELEGSDPVVHSGEMLVWLVVGVLFVWMVAVGFAAWRGDRRRRAERRGQQPPAPTNWSAVLPRTDLEASAAD